jgi:hypothetical protein
MTAEDAATEVSISRVGVSVAAAHAAAALLPHHHLPHGAPRGGVCLVRDPTASSSTGTSHGETPADSLRSSPATTSSQLRLSQRQPPQQQQPPPPTHHQQQRKSHRKSNQQGAGAAAASANNSAAGSMHFHPDPSEAAAAASSQFGSSGHSIGGLSQPAVQVVQQHLFNATPHSSFSISEGHLLLDQLGGSESGGSSSVSGFIAEPAFHGSSDFGRGVNVGGAIRRHPSMDSRSSNSSSGGGGGALGLAGSSRTEHALLRLDTRISDGDPMHGLHSTSVASSPAAMAAAAIAEAAADQLHFHHDEEEEEEEHEEQEEGEDAEGEEEEEEADEDDGDEDDDDDANDQDCHDGDNDDDVREDGEEGEEADDGFAADQPELLASSSIPFALSPAADVHGTRAGPGSGMMDGLLPALSASAMLAAPSLPSSPANPALNVAEGAAALQHPQPAPPSANSAGSTAAVQPSASMADPAPAATASSASGSSGHILELVVSPPVRAAAALADAAPVNIGHLAPDNVRVHSDSNNPVSSAAASESEAQLLKLTSPPSMLGNSPRSIPSPPGEGEQQQQLPSS